MHIFLDAGERKHPRLLRTAQLAADGPRSHYAGMDPAHRLPGEGPRRALEEARKRAVAAGLDVVGPTDHTIFKSIYFFDPSGHRLEVATWTTNPDQMQRMTSVAHMIEGMVADEETAASHGMAAREGIREDQLTL